MKIYQRPFKNLCYVVIVILSSSFALIGQSHDNLKERLKELFKNSNYYEVVRLGKEFRDQDFGRDSLIDFLIGVSQCRLQNQGEGIRYLNWCLGYPLDEGSRQEVLEAMRKCGNGIRNASAGMTTIINVVCKASAGVRGKEYHYVGEGDIIRSSPIEVIAPKTLAELKARLTSILNPSKAVEKISMIVGPGFEIRTYGRFVIASNNPRTDFSEIKRRLEVYRNFFSSSFGLKLPPYMVTIYIVDNIGELRRLASKLHGFKLPSSSIGYCSRDDMSILVLCKYRLTGTLFHELFHLMARTTFGDIPPWLDEGVAALYEVSKIEGNGVIGIKNWRGKVLQDLWNIRPGIRELVSMNWDTFDDEGEGGRRTADKQAVNHATARYFMLYLQNHNKLATVFRKIQSLTPENYEVHPVDDAIKILESVLGKSIDKIDVDFSSWLRIEVGR